MDAQPAPAHGGARAVGISIELALKHGEGAKGLGAMKPSVTLPTASAVSG